MRAEDPVEVRGATLGTLVGVPITEIVVYAYDGSTWAPIPFQIDEVDASGAYTSTEDGLLDDNDVLVFMARDLGVGAPVAQWPADDQARSHSREILRAVDPISGASGVVYVYRSTTLARNATSYVTWDQATQSLTTPAYSAGFDPANFIGLANLSLHGGPDVLDRQKIRVDGRFGGFIPFSVNEETIAGTLGIPAIIDLTVQGPIRAMRSGGSLNVAFYREQFAFQTTLDTSGFDNISVDELRTSFDLNDPATTGLTQFFDSNGTTATIDGNPDVVGTSPIFSWYQVSGDASGPGGMVVSFPNLAAPGTVGNYYLDNGAVDAQDTGDQKSFADTGLRIVGPEGRASITLAGMILPQGTSANVGEAIANRTHTPIVVQATPVRYFDPATLQEIYLPYLQR